MHRFIGPVCAWDYLKGIINKVSFYFFKKIRLYFSGSGGGGRSRSQLTLGDSGVEEFFSVLTDVKEALRAYPVTSQPAWKQIPVQY